MSKIMKKKKTDRLRALPDVLVIHILSFLNTKHAVQASLCLKNWINLWKLFTDLEFDSSVFKKLSSFDTFVDKVLTLRDDSVRIKKFSFSRKGYRNPEFVERITEYAVSHDVQQLRISVDNDRSYMLKEPLDSSYSLCLGQVVDLYLNGITFTGTENFSGCPNLQNLALHHCRFERSSHLVFRSIVAPRLSRLTISDCFMFFFGPKLMLSTPRLTFFKIQDKCLPLLKTDDLPLLETVEIDLRIYDSKDDEIQQLISMLKCFYNAKSIRLSWSAVELLSLFPDILAREPSPFRNIVSLNIVPFVRRKTFSITIPGHVTTYLLRNSPDANTVVELPSCRKCSKRR